MKRSICFLFVIVAGCAPPSPPVRAAPPATNAPAPADPIALCPVEKRRFEHVAAPATTPPPRSAVRADIRFEPALPEQLVIDALDLAVDGEPCMPPRASSDALQSVTVWLKPGAHTVGVKVLVRYAADGGLLDYVAYCVSRARTFSVEVPSGHDVRAEYRVVIRSDTIHAADVSLDLTEPASTPHR